MPKNGPSLLSLALFLLILPPAVHAQAWEWLAKPDADLRGQVVATEEVLDLVEASVADSVVDKRRQHLKGLGGWIAHHTVARYWQYYDSTKRKYIGTHSRPYKIYDGVGMEKDINVFIMPHLPQYVEMVRAGFEVALERPRDVDGFRFDKPADFPLPEPLKFEERGYLTVECEVTPPQRFVEPFHAQFLPAKDGEYLLKDLPNMGVPYPSLGMTGVWCMDCNHNCRPEIHPIEWMWWLDLREDRPGGPDAKSWMVALMFDDSRRFPDWNQSPMTGEIALPFVLPGDAATLEVTLEVLMGDLIEGVSEQWVPARDGWPLAPEATLKLPLAGSDSQSVAIEGLGQWPVGALKVWVTEAAGVGTQRRGHLHIAGKVESLLAMRVTIDH